MIYYYRIGLVDRFNCFKLVNSGFSSILVFSNISCGQRQLILGKYSLGKTTLLSNLFKNYYIKTSNLSSDLLNYSLFFTFLGAKRREYVYHKGIHNSLNKIFTFFIDGSCSFFSSYQYKSASKALLISRKLIVSGVDVLISLDSLDRQSKSFREVMLLLGRAPGREAYPGDVFYLHSNLLEKFGQLSLVFNYSNLTSLPVCGLLSSSLADYITTNLISITDGQCVLSSDLLVKNFRPSVCLKDSVSRIGFVSFCSYFKYICLFAKKNILSYFFYMYNYKIEVLNSIKS